MTFEEMQMRQHCLELVHRRLPFDSDPDKEIALAERYFRYLWDGDTLPAPKIIRTTFRPKPAKKRRG